MKHLIKKYFTLLITTCLVLSGCENWLDVNDNPNTSEKVDAKYLFNYSAVRWSGDRTGGSLYIPLAFATQIQADGGPDVFTGSLYEMPTQRPLTWYNHYVVVGNNLLLALQELQNYSVRQSNAEAQCKILLAMQIYETSLLFGDIPFSEAWKKDIKYPKIDAQKDVLNGILDLLDEAINLIELEDSNCIDDYDPYFDGDMNKWKAVANSFKFRTLMVMVDADPEKASLIGQMVTSGNMISSADNNMEFKYSETPGNGNPKYNLVSQYGTGFFVANNSVLQPMLQYNDSRLPQYFTSRSEGTYLGLNTQEAYNKKASLIGDYLYRANCPDLIYSYQEQLLLEAEVYARGVGIARDLVKANTLYKSGVKAACNYYKADTAQTTAFIKALPDLSELSPEKAIYEIHLQQWIDLMDRPLEAFIQWRRSGPQGQEVPKLEVPPLNPHPGVMRRWEYPDAEISANSNMSSQKLPNIWESMWFDL